MLKLESLKERLFGFFIILAVSFTAFGQETESNDPTQTKISPIEKTGTAGSAAAGESETKPSETTDASPEAPPRNLYRLQRGVREINVEGGYSPFQPTFFAEKEYDTSGRRMSFQNVRFGRIIGTKGPITYQYLFEVIPFIASFNNEVANPAYRSEADTANVPPTIRKTTYGTAVQPATFRFLFRPNGRVKPFGQLGFGTVIFNRPMPLPEATSLNFSGDYGGGVQIFTAPNRAITLGYRYFHISNMHLSDSNPGYNANVFYFGYSFFR